MSGGHAPNPPTPEASPSPTQRRTMPPRPPHSQVSNSHLRCSRYDAAPDCRESSPDEAFKARPARRPQPVRKGPQGSLRLHAAATRTARHRAHPATSCAAPTNPHGKAPHPHQHARHKRPIPALGQTEEVCERLRMCSTHMPQPKEIARRSLKNPPTPAPQPVGKSLHRGPRPQV